MDEVAQNMKMPKESDSVNETIKINNSDVKQSISNANDSDSGPEEVSISRKDKITQPNEEDAKISDADGCVETNENDVSEKKGRKRKRTRNKKFDKEPVKKQHISHPKQMILQKRLTLLQKVILINI